MTQGRRRWRSRLVTSVAAAAVAVGGFGLAQLGAASASADINTGIKVTDMVIQKKHSSQNQGIEGTVTANQLVYATWSWSAAGLDPRAKVGDQFSIQLPPAYALHDLAPFELEISPGNAVGRCTVEDQGNRPRSKILCTLDERLQARYDAGETGVRGTGWFVARTQVAVTESATEFDLNGVKTMVQNPGNAPIGAEVHNFKPQPFYKGNDGVRSDSVAISWNIVWTGDKLAELFPGGKVPQPLILEDTFSAGHKFNGNWRFYALRTKDEPNLNKRRLYASGGEPSNFPLAKESDGIGMFDVVAIPSADGKKVRFEITKRSGEWSKDIEYLLSYGSVPETPNGKINPGLRYENAVSLKGTDVVRRSATRYVASAGATAELEQGYGSFRVTKTLSGEAAGQVPAGTKVKFLANWTLPNGKTAQDYPGWDAPANPVEIMATIGEVTTYFPNARPFPAGTTIELSEHPTFAEPALPGGVVWDQPTLTIPGSATATARFTIETGKVTGVDAENKATYLPKVRVGDYVWFDANDDGLQDSSDEPLAGWTLELSRSDKQPVRGWDLQPRQQLTTETNDQGRYIFEDLEPLPQGVGYVVTIQPKPGYQSAKETPGAATDQDSSAQAGFAQSGDLTADGAKEDLTLDFGYVKQTPGIDIEKFDGGWSGVIFDSEGVAQLKDKQPIKLPEGDRDTAENALVVTGLAEQEVKFTVTNTAKAPLKNVVVSDVTNDGPDLVGLACVIDGKKVEAVGGRVQAPADWVFYHQDEFGCTAKLPAFQNAAVHSNTATVTAVPVAGGTPVTDSDSWHAKRAKVSVGDYVWFDSNKDGVQGAPDAEPGIKDVVLTISRSDDEPVKQVDGTEVTTTKTDKDGKYLFKDLEVLPDGQHYLVRVTQPEGMLPTLNTGTDRETNSSTHVAHALELKNDGDKDLSLDFGFIKAKVSVGDYVWFDKNKDGLQDATDVPLKDVTLTIARTDGQPAKQVDGSVVTTTKTDAAGKYLFDNLEILPAGVLYQVSVEDVRGYLPTKQGPGNGSGNNDSSTGVALALPLLQDGQEDLSLDFGFVKAKVSVGDYVWLDVNKDGLQDDGEKGIQDVVLTISRTDNKPVKKVDGSVVDTTKTDAAGKYLFADLEILPAGEKYVVTVTDPAGYVATKAEQGSDRAMDSSTGSATAVELTQDGAKDLTLDFGFFFPEVSVGDYVWFDTNKDGLQDGSDVPLKDVVLAISRSDGKAVNNADHTPRTELTTTTDTNGKYAFNGLEVLTGEVKYVVTVTAPFGYVPTKAGMNNGAGSDDSSTNTSASVKDLSTDGASDPTLDFGFIKAKVSVGDYVWFDKDKDGVQDANEPGIEDVTLTLTGPDGKSVTDVDGNPVGPVKTNNEGKYIFENLPVLPKGESYTVTVSDPEGYLPTKAGANNGAGSDDSSTGFSVSVADLSTDGASDPTLDFGYFKPSVSVGDYVFEDVNDNGVQDQGDKPIKDVTLTLTGPDGKSVTDVDGNPVGPVKTNNEGKYIFENLPVLKDGQSYTVTVTPPAGYEPAKTGQGTRETDSSKDKATSIGLTKDGQQDLSLDFGFKKPTPPTPPATPSATPKGGKLAKTGANAQTLLPVGLALLAAGGILIARKKRNG